MKKKKTLREELMEEVNKVKLPLTEDPCYWCINNNTCLSGKCDKATHPLHRH